MHGSMARFLRSPIQFIHDLSAIMFLCIILFPVYFYPNLISVHAKQSFPYVASSNGDRSYMQEGELGDGEIGARIQLH